MDFSEPDQAECIAKDWGVSSELLRESEGSWTLGEYESDGTTVGYYVQFDDDTDRELLDMLGFAPGDFTRHVGLNAFDQPDYEEMREREGKFDPHELVAEYLRLGGTRESSVVGDGGTVRHWRPEPPEAEAFWNEHIQSLSELERYEVFKLLPRVR